MESKVSDISIKHNLIKYMRAVQLGNGAETLEVSIKSSKIDTFMRKLKELHRGTCVENCIHQNITKYFRCLNYLIGKSGKTE